MKRPLMLLLTLVGAVVFTGAAVRALATADIPSAGDPGSEQRNAPRQSAAQTSVRRHSPQDAASPSCDEGKQDSGATYRICTPTIPWNRDLVVYAHGYVAPDKPVEIPEDQMSLPGTSVTIDQVATALGYAFATTSYYTNGLAVLPALSDLLDLVNIFTTTVGVPDHIYLVGVSEGGLITALSVEQHPDVYDGGLAMCGPYGDFRDQINHYGDFRVVFDYFFPDLMPGEPFSVPASLREEWQSGFFTETIQPQVTDPANAISVTQLMTVTSVSPYAYAPPTSTESISKLLWYNVFATDDAMEKLGGQPFDNHDRPYSGSNDDAALNNAVERFTADQAALDEIATNYQTTGKLRAPLVTLHTTGDEGVPYRHATQYLSKTQAADTPEFHEHFRVKRHGHCNFTPFEVLNAFDRLVAMVTYRDEFHIFLPLVAEAP